LMLDIMVTHTCWIPNPSWPVMFLWSSGPRYQEGLIWGLPYVPLQL
jgi:hypothetical protein